ncbi:MAG TPA: hypothetical protein VHO29_18900 [Marmoricola sp.]|nr:hypothetical protein [Marmoricola sp.]
MTHGIRPGLLRLRAAFHAAAGAPKLYRAARGEGAGRLQAARMLALSAVVLFVVAPRAAGVPGRQNAVRHFVWQALLTARYGERVATAVADAQEQGAVDAADSAVDRHNNAVAHAYASAHAEQLAALSTGAALRPLFEAALAHWEAGELSGGRAAARAARRRRRGWRGRATPRTPT